MAAELGITRGVVVEAYAQLVAEGYLTSRSGGYTQVAAAPAPHRHRRTASAAPGPGQPAPSRPPRPMVDFGYGRGNLAAFPRAAWLRSVRRVLIEAADERLGYLDGRGAVELRSALAAYLNRVRGTNADPETIVITDGYAQAVSLLLGVLAARGARTVAVENRSAADDARIRQLTPWRLDADLPDLSLATHGPTKGLVGRPAGTVSVTSRRLPRKVVLDEESTRAPCRRNGCSGPGTRP